MLFRMHLSFSSALAWVNAFGIGSAGQDEGSGVKNVAIIGKNHSFYAVSKEETIEMEP